MSWTGSDLIGGGQWDAGALSYSPSFSNNAPVVSPPAALSLEFANGGAGLEKSNPALQAWIVSGTALDSEDGALSVLADLSGLPDPIPASQTPYSIPFVSEPDSGGLTGTGYASLAISEAQAANDPPLALGNYPQQPATVGVFFTFDASTLISDSDILAFAATGLPEGWTINSNTGVVSGVATGSGNYTIQINATDTAGQTLVDGQGNPAVVLLPVIIDPAPSNIVLFPINRTVLWDSGKTPVLVIGDTFWHLATLLQGVDSEPFDVSGADTVRVRFVDQVHENPLCETVDISAGTGGADWASGVISMLVSSEVTAQISEHISKKSLAVIEIEVGLGGNSFTWFAPVQLVPGFIQ